MSSSIKRMPHCLREVCGGLLTCVAERGWALNAMAVIVAVVVVAVVVAAVVSLSYQNQSGPGPRKPNLPHLAAPCRWRREISRVVGFNFFHDWKHYKIRHIWKGWAWTCISCRNFFKEESGSTSLGSSSSQLYGQLLS